MTRIKSEPLWPSSQVTADEVKVHGWYALRELPSAVNTQGRLAPTPEESEKLRGLRAEIDNTGRALVATKLGTAAIQNFATNIEPAPTSEESRLMLYVLKPELLHPEDV